MSALSLAVPPAQAVFAFPSPEQPWSSPSPTAQPTESPVLSAATAAWTIALPASSPPPPPPKFKWRNPKRMVDLSAFNISAFSGGRHNIEIVQGIPDIIASFDVSSAHIDANATASSSSSSSTTTTTSDSDSDSSSDSPDALASALATHWPPSTSTLQLHYPAGSINPAQPHRPIGGAQFYATPLDLARAHNVSLAYSAFFPVDFAWVRGGKMPGLYGGRGGCSGGDEARDCWSTRLMWRAGGEGEMYLYAPKSKQPPTLCASPRSVCSTTYGLSIGRGAFTWGTGRWTRVVQTVVLNTPGRGDGCFVLDVDGERVVERCDVFYRDVPRGGGGGGGGGGGTGGGKEGGGGGIGGLIGTLLSDLLRREATATATATAATATATETAVETPAAAIEDSEDQGVPVPSLGMYDAQQGWTVGPASASAAAATASATATNDPGPTPTSSSSFDANANANAEDDGSDADADTDTDAAEQAPIDAQAEAEAVGFTGLFFSSFFGGHTAPWATPTDQYVWFKDFYISYNA